MTYPDHYEPIIENLRIENERLRTESTPATVAALKAEGYRIVRLRQVTDLFARVRYEILDELPPASGVSDPDADHSTSELVGLILERTRPQCMTKPCDHMTGEFWAEWDASRRQLFLEIADLAGAAVEAIDRRVAGVSHNPKDE